MKANHTTTKLIIIYCEIGRNCKKKRTMSYNPFFSPSFVWLFQNKFRFSFAVKKNTSQTVIHTNWLSLFFCFEAIFGFNFPNKISIVWKSVQILSNFQFQNVVAFELDANFLWTNILTNLNTCLMLMRASLKKNQRNHSELNGDRSVRHLKRESLDFYLYSKCFINQYQHDEALCGAFSWNIFTRK